ncbi:hypothetical protein [Cellulomonas humilata]|uniref:Uncharacterized protein n=1 Tax=Cellulomonas humilata TaxID=144055 RepID=A0ABU0EHE3_9CELL|nr:hypothetical protein [Cellulomonas humilata]MDQ0374705.1 hypothetical protein [Cellulomonas humilata]
MSDAPPEALQHAHAGTGLGATRRSSTRNSRDATTPPYELLQQLSPASTPPHLHALAAEAGIAEVFVAPDEEDTHALELYGSLAGRESPATFFTWDAGI